MVFGGKSAWACIGNTHIGKSHIESGLPCQDKVAFFCNKYGTTAALCDGLGSRENSHFGAAIVSNAVVDLLSDNYNYLVRKTEKEIGTIVLYEVNKAVKKYAKENKVNRSSLECTLLFASINKGHYIIGKIGDGVLGTFKGPNVVDCLYLSKGGEELEYANATYTVLDDDADKHLIVKKGNAIDIDSLFMISDGLPFLSSNGKTANKLLEFFNTMNESECSFSSNIIYKELSKKVEESELCVDDWSYIFASKLSNTSKVSTYTKKQMNDLDGSNQ